MNFRSPLASCGCGGPSPSLVAWAAAGFSAREAAGGTSEVASWKDRGEGRSPDCPGEQRGPIREVAARGGRLRVPAPRRTAGARGAPARPPGPPQPGGSLGARQLLPAARASASSVAARVPGAPRPRAPGASAARQRLSELGAALASLCPR